MSSDILTTLCSQRKIERDSGVVQLHKVLSSGCINARINIENEILRLLSSSKEIPWETKHGCLLGAKEIILKVDNDLEPEALFLQQIQKLARSLLTDSEVRVRLESGEVFGSLCKKVGTSIYEEEKEFVVNLIVANLERQALGEGDSSSLEHSESEKLVEKLVGSNQRRNSADAAQIFHDTAGWKNLETSLKCLQAMIQGCGAKFQPYVNLDLLTLLFRTLTHTNRFVRESGYYVCSTLVRCGYSEEGKEQEVTCETNGVFQFGHELSRHLALGLADNWSQVRMAASDATRHFLLSLPPQARLAFYPQLLPQMCLNRYYIAEGVRIYSQETWRQVMGGSGRSMVQRYISETVAYYAAATQADNHAVREAACACIAELGNKLDPAVVRPHVPTLLDSLLTCFQDDSWPVRDAACLASGHFVLCFPEESRAALDSLYPLFFRNLGDPIASVRQGASVALADVVKAYGQPALQVVLEKMKLYIEGIKDQPAEVENNVTESVGCGAHAKYGLIKRLRDNDMEAHTDQQMYSCGSLAPKMGRGGGCSDHKFNRPSQPWEKADGCVYLMTELSTVPEAAKEVLQLLPLVAEACKYQHYPQHVVFLETVCKQLPLLAKHLGVRPFKAYLDYFLEPIFRSTECENALTSSTASQCLNQLSSLVGPNILRARVNNFDPRYLDKLDANMFIAPF